MENKVKKFKILAGKRFISVFLLLPFAFCLFTFAPHFAARRHTFHTSLTRIDYNAREKLAEISIQVFTHDLVPVLERFAKKNVDLEKTPDIDKLILKYLNANFILKDKKGAAKKLVWVGKEQKVDRAYIYVEIPMNTGFDGFTLRNTIFFESFPKQVNVVVARYNEKKVDLIFNVGDQEKLISPKTEAQK
jgi:hypothetical protein